MGNLTELNDLTLGISSELLISTTSSLPWCCIVDFNVIMWSREKRGHIPHSQYLFRGFRDAVADSQLLDWPLHGYQFTWEKGRGSSHWIEEHLGRALVTLSWLNVFPNSSLNNLVAPVFDHTPIELLTTPTLQPNHKVRFRFENSNWLREDELQQVVLNSWSDLKA